MRIVDGYGIQYQAFNELKDKNVKYIIIKETTGNEWKASLETWTNHNKIADYGSGKQVFMSLKFMDRKQKVEPNPFTPPTYKPVEKDKQEKLF
jgi:hypothetical protein